MIRKLEKSYFMFRRFLKDFRKPLRFEIQNPERMHLEQLEEYYLLFREGDMQQQKGGKSSFQFDKKGIPIVPSYIDVEEKSFHYYPITIGQYGLSIFHTYLESKSEHDKKRFLNIADWFMNNKSEDEKRGVYWLTHTEKPEYRVKTPWLSAFSQSRALSILLRAYQLTKKEAYLESAKGALQLFDIPIEQGGVRASHNDAIIYEEYTASFKIMVLDGAFFSLYGLFDYQRLFPNDSFVSRLITDGIEGLIRVLPDYDLGFWLKYSLVDQDFYPKNEPATKAYFHLILTQLRVFYAYTKRDEFKHFYEKFSSYDSFSNMIKMYGAKYKSLKQLNRL